MWLSQQWQQQNQNGKEVYLPPQDKQTDMARPTRQVMNFDACISSWKAEQFQWYICRNFVEAMEELIQVR